MEEIGQHEQEEMINLYGRNKTFLAGFKLPCLIALSGYPELADIEIEFRAQKSNTPGATRPTNSSIFRKGKNRRYCVYITTEIIKERADVLPASLTFEIQVGLIAHELGHVCDYLQKNSFSVISTGLFYGFKAYKRKLEQRVDLMTVQHGFGLELMRYAQLIVQLQQKVPNDDYFKSYFDFYMRPEEIRKHMWE